MNNFYFSKKAKKEFEKLQKDVQLRIMEKLKFLRTHKYAFQVLKTIKEMEPASHRLKVGNYRLLLEFVNSTKERNEFDILKVGHRREIYE